jgi:hypothetical protein
MKKLNVDPKNWRLWIPLILFLKALFFIFFLTFFSNTPINPNYFKGFWGVISSDTFSYLTPIENLIDHSDYSYLFEFRMFGYGLPYLFVRFFLEQGIALNAIIILQGIFSSISLYLLALLSFNLFNKRILFHLTFLSYFLIPILSFYDVIALTESFSTSSLIISLFLLLYKRNKGGLILSGLFLTWTVFLRPIFFPICFIYLLYILVAENKNTITQRIKLSLFLLAPLFFFESIWIAGNYYYHKKISVTTPTVFHPLFLDQNKHTIELINFLKSIGEDWENNNWFYSANNDYPYSKNINTSLFNKDSLIKLKQEIQITQSELITFNPSTPDSVIVKLNHHIKQKLNNYTNSVKEEKSFYYYVISPLKYLFKISTASSTQRMFGEYNTMNKHFFIFRIIIDGYVWFIQLCFLIFFIIALIFKRISINDIFISLIVFYFYFIHSVIFRSDDFRYIIPIIPFEIIFANAFIYNYVQKFLKKDQNKLI